ncbi:transporter substrate-binding domain-containing protein [Methanorbis rubei]|uniref:ABC transporter arginine-binding protein 1 n=1 Tax=Methanorbis rubei TaxID=3028300 RepID=A0AAE4MG95_9EURY|nr:ABC transporter arginine-binding protein 1 [Methanocorpusculaceae archaeon Cs1]
MDKKVLYGVAGLCLLFAVLMAGCVTTPSDDEKKTYIVGIDADYPPFSYLGDNGQFIGFDVESVKWIAEEQGFNVEIKAVAWDGIIPALQTGKIDMVYSGMTITPERAEKVNFTIPYWQVNQGIAAKNGSTFTTEQFKNGELTIGVQRSCSADQWMQDFFGDATYNQMVKDGKIMLYDTFPMSMVALEQGRVQTVIFDDVNIEDYIKSKPELKFVGVIETEEFYGVAVRKDDNELRATMDVGLAKLMASDKWTELIQKYIITDEVAVVPTEEETTAVPTSDANATATTP